MTPDLEPLFPKGISDEAASVLSEFLYALAMACESRYFTQLDRYHARQRAPCDPQQPWKKLKNR